MLKNRLSFQRISLMNGQVFNISFGMEDSVRDDVIEDSRIIIVEGVSDKRHLEKILDEQVNIICTYGTFGVEKFDIMLEEYELDDRDVYIFVDADEPGVELRSQLAQELPHAIHLYVSDEWGEVEVTPEKQVAIELVKHDFNVHSIYLM